MTPTQKIFNDVKGFGRSHFGSIVGIATTIGFILLNLKTIEQSVSEIVIATAGIITTILILTLEMLLKIINQNEKQRLNIKSFVDTLHLVEIIDKDNLSVKYQELREIAMNINATWCGKYETTTEVVGDYFGKELKFLKNMRDKGTSSTVICRLINPLAISYQELCIHRDYMENLQKEGLDNLYDCRLTTDIRDLEYLLVQDKNGKKHAVFSIVSDFTPGFGIALSADKHQSEVDAFFTRFNEVFKHTDKIRSGNELWNNMTEKWSEFYVNLKPNDPLKIYCDEELDRLADVCQKLSDQKLPFTVIEVGSGAGNFLYELRKKLNNNNDQFIGIECADKMTECAKKKHAGVNNLNFIDFDFLDEDISKIENKITNKNSVRIICCMLNTLGLVRPSKRKTMIKNMQSLAKGGYVILSIFNSDRFSEMAQTIYGSLNDSLKNEFEIDNLLSYSDRETAIKTSNGYTSQWIPTQKMKEYCTDLPRPQTVDIPKNGKQLTLAYIYILSGKNNKISPVT